MSRIHSVPRHFTLPVDLDEPSAKACQRDGSPSTSPLRFQQGFLKIPEGVCKPMIGGSGLFRTSLSPSYVLRDQEQHIITHGVFPVLSELADQETRILQIAAVRKHQRAHWLSTVAAALGYPAGASAVISLYLLVPALRLSSFMGLLGWDRLVPFGMLGLAECSIIAIMLKTTAMGQRQFTFEGMKPSLVGAPPGSLPAQVPYHLSVRGSGRW